VIDIFENLALNAGSEIMNIRARGVLARLKSDASPVTDADERAEAIILTGLQTHFPTIPIVAEEAIAAGHSPRDIGTRFFLVDPLDGTKEFISGSCDFTVNIALIENGVPTFGVVYAPAHSALYSAHYNSARKSTVINGVISSSSPLQRFQHNGPPRIVASRSHMSEETLEFVSRYPESELVSIGSSLKFCLLAEGKADLYPRFGRTMEWDTAAGDAILRAAGGCTQHINGETLTYGKPHFENGFFIARV
jgi:3'(2'), 5'-bisphosphate nucleotidase